VIRLAANGNLVHTYLAPAGDSDWFALNRDPDGTSFWTADLVTRHIYRIDIATGNVLTSFTAGGAQTGDDAQLKFPRPAH